MDAVSVSIVADGQDGFNNTQRLACINLFLLKSTNSIKNFQGDLVQPLGQATIALDQADLLNPFHWKGKSLHHVDDVCWIGDMANIGLAYYSFVENQ